MSELPKSTTDAEVTVVQVGTSYVMQFRQRTGESLDSNIVWTPRRPLRLKTIVFSTDGHILAAGQYIGAQLILTPPGQGSLNVMKCYYNGALTHEVKYQVFPVGLVFPADTEFNVWLANSIPGSVNTPVLTLHFEYLASQAEIPVTSPVSRCGVLEEIMGLC